MKRLCFLESVEMFTHAWQQEQDMGGDYAARTPEVDGETSQLSALCSLCFVFPDKSL